MLRNAWILYNQIFMLEGDDFQLIVVALKTLVLKICLTYLRGNNMRLLGTQNINLE